MFSSGTFVSKENKEHVRIILPFVALFTLLFLLTSRNPFFLDKDILFSKIAFWLIENNFSPVLPDTIDPGYPPALGYLLAIGWKVFGTSLFVSHAIIFPFTIGIIWQVYRLLSAYLPKEALALSMLVVLADSTFLSQSTLFSTDIVMLFFFLLSLNALVKNRRIILALAITGMLFSHMRGMSMVAVVFLFDIYKLGQRRSFASLSRLSMYYSPGILLFVFWLIYHAVTKGWSGYHQNSPWIESFEIVDFKGFMKNIMVLGWRLIDYGKIFLWLAALYFSVRLMKKKISVDHGLQDLFVLLVLVIMVTAPAMLVYQNLSGHRYLLVVNVLLSSIITYLLFTKIASAKIRKYFVMVITAGILSGNFWVYPDKIAKGWDASLAYLPYHHLRKQMVHYLDKKSIPFQDVGTESPNTILFKYIEANDDERAFKRADLGRDQYVFYSNICNMFTDEEIDILKKVWIMEKEYRFMQVSVRLYRNPYWYDLSKTFNRKTANQY